MERDPVSAWHAGTHLAILGARRNSLGHHVAGLHTDGNTTTIGPGEDHDYDWVYEFIGGGIPDLSPYDNVLCTIGMNLPDHEDPLGEMQMMVNYHAPLALMREWMDLGKPGHFVVVSSNSAHIARSPSVGYCASKAAVSMAVRSMARKGGEGIFYAWEFGLLEGTPMTAATVRQVGPGVPLTRMRGLPNGIPVDQAAGHVYRALKHGWRELNGTTLRVDAGEQ